MPAVQSSTCIIYNKFAYMWNEIFTTDGDLRNLSSVATEVELKITVFLFYSTTGKLYQISYLEALEAIFYKDHNYFLLSVLYFIFSINYILFFILYFHFIGRSNDLLIIYSLNIAFYIYIIKIIFIIIFEKVVPLWHTFFNSSIVVFHALYQCFS